MVIPGKAAEFSVNRKIKWIPSLCQQLFILKFTIKTPCLRSSILRPRHRQERFANQFLRKVFILYLLQYTCIITKDRKQKTRGLWTLVNPFRTVAPTASYTVLIKTIKAPLLLKSTVGGEMVECTWDTPFLDSLTLMDNKVTSMVIPTWTGRNKLIWQRVTI